MAAHDLLLRRTSISGNPSDDTIGKDPYFRTAGVDYTITDGIAYLNNSLEGHLFDDAGSGFVTGPIHPNFNFFDAIGPGTLANIVNTHINPDWRGVTRANGLVTVNIIAHGLNVGDIFSIRGITFDSTHTVDLNGVYKVFQKLDDDAFQFIKLGEDLPYYTTAPTIRYTYPASVRLFKHEVPVITIYDNRAPSDVSGLSFTSVLLSPLPVTDVSDISLGLKKRIVPEDLYVRFKIADSTGELGGLNAAMFDVIDTTTSENVKPIIWAWFFGGATKITASDFTSADRDPENNFDIIFNSYAIVLRPSGSGTYLEFALLKFNWGAVSGANWFTNFIGTPLIYRVPNPYVNGIDLGYLISTNPNVAKTSGTPRVVEITKSSSFLYDASKPLELNLKVSIRKHSLSDQSTDNTYYCQLAVNPDYNSFGDGAQYSNVMHSFIQRPRTNGLSTVTFQAMGYVPPANYTDIGKTVTDGVNTYGQLVWYDNTLPNPVWWLRNNPLTVPASASLTLVTGTGAGIAYSPSVVDANLPFVIPMSDDATTLKNYLLMPWMYFKYVNLNPTAYNVNASTIKIDNIMFRQMNSSNKLYF